MKGLIATCRPGTGEKVDINGNPVEPGNRIPPANEKLVGKDAGSMEIMPVDVVNGQWGLQHGVELGDMDLIGGRINSGRHPGPLAPGYLKEPMAMRKEMMQQMYPFQNGKGLGLRKVLEMMMEYEG